MMPLKMSEFTTAASNYAARVDETFWILSGVSVAVVLLVFALILGFVIRYRRDSTAPRGELPEFMKREVEIGWTVATLILFLFMFWWAGVELLNASSPPAKALEIHVVAKQWMFRIQQPTGAREINEIHIPIHTAVRLAMTSEDVIHDLFIPALRIKRDILPDRYTYLWFTATKTGTFWFTCAQFCGTNHSQMSGSMIVMDQASYARWTTAQPQSQDLARLGKALFHSLGCSGCHAAGSSVHAPDLHGVYGRPVHLTDGRTVIADEAYLRDKILLPNKELPIGYKPIMPSFRGIVTEGQIVELIAYLKSLGTGAEQQGAKQ